MNYHSFFKGQERTVKAKKNIVASVFLKGIDGLVYLLLVPVTLGYLNEYEYGIWLTLNSILMWINSFDIGLGNGMRNKLAEAIANGDRQLGRIYVSTTFFMLIGLMGLLVIVGTILEPFINWYNILNTTPERVPHLDGIVYIAFTIFCINFIFKFIGNVYLAMQLPAVNNLMIVSGHFLSLTVIYILTLTTNGSLLWVSVVYSASPLFVYLLAYPVSFKVIFPFLKPSILLFSKKHINELFNVGIQFFILQVTGIILFSLSNILISHMFGPTQVTPYNITFRYFSIVSMVMGLLITPFWSATTDAYVKQDYNWIKNIEIKLKKILLICYLVLIVMCYFSDMIYHLWIGKSINIPIEISISMAIYTAIVVTSSVYSSFIYGFGKLRLQLINASLMALFFYPICFVMAKIYGIIGIIIGMSLLHFSGVILNYIQFKKLINNRAFGIWGR